MDDWLPSSVGVNDLILMESSMTRWACNGEGRMTYEKNGNLKRVTMRLESLSMLFVGPDEQEQTDEDDAEEESYQF